MRIFVVAGLMVLSCAAAQAQECNRDCLRGFVDRYLAALVARNPQSLPLAPNVRFTEDTVERKLGEGLWQGATGLGGYRQDILDVRQSTAAALVVVEENGAPVLLALRLKIAGGRIAEIETMAVRNREEGAIFQPENLRQASAAMNVTPPADQRLPREEAIRIANYYPRGLIAGSFVAVDAPFAPGAYRIENGGRMAGPGCTRDGCQDIKTQRIIAHPALTSRLIAVDEEQGIVLLRMNFGNTGSYGPGNALIVWEAFKVYGGRIHAVEAFMEIMPEKAGSGWD